MKVIAAQGVRVPKEDKPREYITDAKPVDVPKTAYYVRRVAEGDLAEVTDTADAADASGGSGTDGGGQAEKTRKKGAS